MTEGFRRAGVHFDQAFDFDPNACDSHQANIGTRPIQMDVRDLIRMVHAGWSPGQLELLVADPPCTPWSRAGNRKGVDDDRDMLKATAELIGLLRPRCYLIGNVPGLQDATTWHIVQDVIGGLSRFGYCTNDYFQLDAADYGVPQHRVRPFWFGHQRGPCWRPPAPTHCDPKSLATLSIPGTELPPWVTCKSALEHLPIAELGRPVRQRVNKKHPASRPDEPSMVITTNGGRHQSNAVEARISQGMRIGSPDAPGCTISSRASRVGAGAAVVLEWPRDRPATTLMADPRIAPPGRHIGSDRSNPNAIVLSERAGALLQGFPDGWHFAGKTKKARWGQIGMAMPPALAEAVARSIRGQQESS